MTDNCLPRCGDVATETEKALHLDGMKSKFRAQLSDLKTSLKNENPYTIKNSLRSTVSQQLMSIEAKMTAFEDLQKFCTKCHLSCVDNLKDANLARECTNFKLAYEKLLALNQKLRKYHDATKRLLERIEATKDADINKLDISRVSS
jgi:hypothetical protein